MRYGFTGSRKGTDQKKILAELKRLRLKKGDVVITGGCVGVDYQIAKIIYDYYPNINQEVVIPADKKMVDVEIYFLNCKIIPMPSSTDFRDRDGEIVKRSDRVVAFWNGNKRSGTYMTMNIARKAGKLYKVIKI